MRIFTRMGLWRHESQQRREWIQWAMQQAGYPVPKGVAGLEQHVINALQKTADDPLPEHFWRDQKIVEGLGGVFLEVPLADV